MIYVYFIVYNWNGGLGEPSGTDREEIKRDTEIKSIVDIKGIEDSLRRRHQRSITLINYKLLRTESEADPNARM